MSEVAIWNAALTILGDEPILTPDEDSARARCVRGRYAAVRDAELRRRRWRFAIHRVSIAALSAAPDSDYARQFQVPNDFLRLIEGGDIRSYADLSDYRGSSGAALYSLEGRRILTDLAAPLSIRYIRKVTDTAMFDPAFTEALAARLAWACCKKITGNDAEKDRCQDEYRTAIKEAARANALENPPVPIADDTWITARLS
jgi:hypothetical protein